MAKTGVVIAGAGPTGLMLAYELQLAGINVRIIDKLEGRSGESRAGGIHARTMEVLDQRGLVERFLEAGQAASRGHFAGLDLDFSRLETKYPLILQSTVEQLLDESLAESVAEFPT